MRPNNETGRVRFLRFAERSSALVTNPPEFQLTFQAGRLNLKLTTGQAIHEITRTFTKKVRSLDSDKQHDTDMRS